MNRCCSASLSVDNLEIEPYAPDNVINISSENMNASSIKTLQDIIKKYDSHPSFIKINENAKKENIFSFTDMKSLDLENEIIKLDKKKANMDDDIPTKVLIGTKDIVSNYLSNYYNDSINDQKYPMSLKRANVIPVHKKHERTLMTNYRPVCLLPIVSKIFERNMYKQILIYIDKFLSPYLFGFRKRHSSEQCLIIMLEVWKKAIGEKKCAGGILTDLSKAFDCLNHDLLIARFNTYGFNQNALIFIYSYLKERKQRIKVESSYSSWKELIFGVPLGSILGPFIFNTFLNDVFYFMNKTKITNYADDNTPYSIEENIINLLNTLEIETSVLLKWFDFNEMKSNVDKCHLIVVNNNDVSVNLGNETINGSTTVDLLGVRIDNNLNFNEHVSKLCKK